jgi:peptidyl-prolyl cis-trans isomerase C
MVATVATVALSGCSPKRSGEVLARVGNTVITTDDFKHEMQWRLDHSRPLPEKSALLEEMIAHELALQKVQALGLEKDFNVQRNYQELLVGELRDRELAPKLTNVKVSAQEIEDAYKRDIARYTIPAKIRVALIYRKFDTRMTAEQKADIETRMAAAEAAAKALKDFSRGFGAIAMDYSEDQASRYRGGDVGWIDENSPVFRWPKDMVQAAFALQQKGDISPVIRTSKGLFLLMKTDYREKSATPLANASISIQRRLLAEKKQQVEQDFAKELRGSASVQTDAVALLQIDYPTTKVAQVEEKLPPALPRSQ